MRQCCINMKYMIHKDAILQKLKADGHRLTKARLAIIEFLTDANRPSTAATILSTLKCKGFLTDRATVYRELNFLIANNIVSQVQFTGKVTHYEIESDHHHHLVCIKCNSIKEIVLGKHLGHHERQIFQKEKFKVVSHALEFYGLCQNCQT